MSYMGVAYHDLSWSFVFAISIINTMRSSVGYGNGNSFCLYSICIITKCADTDLVPPASGVIVKAVGLPAGF